MTAAHLIIITCSGAAFVATLMLVIGSLVGRRLKRIAQNYPEVE